MARHIMAVCVVCLLCADQLPCLQHPLDTVVFAAAIPPAHSVVYYEEKLNARVYQRIERNANVYGDELLQATSTAAQHERHKRHAGHDHDAADKQTPHRPEITGIFLERIFKEYGQGDGTINIEEFRQMLTDLGLHQLLLQKLSATNPQNTSEKTCIDDRTLVHHIQPPHEHSHHHHDDEASAVNCSGDVGACATKSVKQERHAHPHSDSSHKHANYTISKDDMLNLCPVLLYQLASPNQAKRNGCIDASLLQEIEAHDMLLLNVEQQDIMYVWIYAFISVFACGILGLVGVAIIPFMDSRYYKHIIQYLVSLAVGTMTGDALLHLLPHSLAGQSESNMVFKGLTCMSGIVFFYMTEHGLTMISEWRKRIAKQESTKPSRAKVVRDPESSMNNSVAGDKLCKSKYSSYPYCYDEIAMDTKNDVHLPPVNKQQQQQQQQQQQAQAQRIGDGPNNVASKRNGKSDAEGTETATVQSLLPNTYTPMSGAESCNHNHNHHEQPSKTSSSPQQQQQQQQQNALADSNTISTDLDGNSVGGEEHSSGTNGGKIDAIVPDTAVTVILREHESSHHGHSHKHGHVHSPPESLSAVAWMIIMGDGLHNFTDGMAIGAAFAENITGGFSTSLAVFCHELPHELGDFAILMKAGMSVKSAVYYNLLTGVLSFIGMIFGIVFGQTPEIAQWMFAAAAGLFIYIALVDMMPELSSSHKSVEQFILQIVGMCSGVLLMLLIAIYEGDLIKVFSTPGSVSTNAATSFSMTPPTTTYTTTTTTAATNV